MEDQGSEGKSSTFPGPRVVPPDTNDEEEDDRTMIQQQLAQHVKHQEWEAVTMLVQSHPELVKVPYHRHGWTLLSWLCSAGGTPATLLDLVASRHPAALRVRDTYLGDTALHLVARHCQWSADKLRSLLPYCRCCCCCDDGNDSHAGDTNSDPSLLRNRLGGTALHAAAHHNAVLDALQALIQHNPAILHVTTHEGIHAVTALWLAYMQTIPGYMTVARILKHEEQQQQQPPPSNAAAAENPVWDRFWAKVEYLALQSYWSKQQQQHDLAS